MDTQLGSRLNQQIKIVCHRGANELAPESPRHAEHCIDWGMDYLELDVNTSRDGDVFPAQTWLERPMPLAARSMS